MRRIMIVGASGRLGEKLIALSQNRGFEAYGTYMSNPIKVDNPLRLDITDRTSVLASCRNIRPDMIINSAALADVDACERQRDLAVDINANAPGYLAEASRLIGTHLLQVSTDYVFDGEKGMYSEGDEPNPVNHYGESKLLGEMKVSSTAQRWCIARTSVVFGWGRRERPNFATWVIGGLRDGKRLNVVTDQYASPTLDANLAAMLLEIAEKGLTGTYHVAGCDRINRYDMASKIAEAFDLDKTQLAPVGSSSINWLAKRPKDSSLDVSKASDALSIKPLRLDEALTEMKQTED